MRSRARAESFAAWALQRVFTRSDMEGTAVSPVEAQAMLQKVPSSTLRKILFGQASRLLSVRGDSP